MNEKLKIKLSQTHQRRKLRETSQWLPKNIQCKVNLKDITYKEEVYANHNLAIYPKNIDGELAYPEGYSLYQYKEYDQLLKIADCVIDIYTSFDKNCVISLDPDSGFFILELQYIEDFLKFYSTNLNSNDPYLALFQSDYKKGIIIDSYCGYLPEHLSTNKNEIVYEFLYWQRE